MAQGPKTTLTWKRYTETDDGVGGSTFVWAKIKDIIGTLAILSDRERMMYGKKAEGCDYKFTVDYSLATKQTGGSELVIATKDRFYLGARIFEIDGIENPMNQNRFLVFLLSEHVNG